MTVPAFVDANVLMCRPIDSGQAKHLRTDGSIRLPVSRGCGPLSIQILTESYPFLTRRPRPVLPESRARDIVRDFFSWDRVTFDSALLETCWNRRTR